MKGGGRHLHGVGALRPRTNKVPVSDDVPTEHQGRARSSVVMYGTPNEDDQTVPLAHPSVPAVIVPGFGVAPQGLTSDGE